MRDIDRIIAGVPRMSLEYPREFLLCYVKAPRSPWNIAFWLRYVHNHAKREFFRFRHGPFLDTANSFETVK